MKAMSGVLLTCLALVFLFSAATKVRRPLAFLATVRDYAVLPAAAAPFVAILVMADESLLAGSFAWGWFLQLSVPLALATLIVFTFAVSVNLVRKRSVRCGCFGHSAEVISAATLRRLAVLMLVVLALWFTITNQRADAAALFASRDVGYIVGVGTLAVAATLVGMWLSVIPRLVPAISPMAAPKKPTEESIHMNMG
jgi:hypothetical protein